MSCPTFAAQLQWTLREVTCLDDPTLREVALGGPDTSVRVKVVWQVRLHRVDGAPADCPERAAAGKDPGGFLNVTTDQSGYRGPENHLYRLEIHRSGGVGEATFKWSRDNGSVAAPVEKIEGHSLTFGDAGIREGRSFAPSQWVEVSDDARELDGQSGDLYRIVALDDARRTMTLTEAPRSLASGANGVDPDRHPKVRRWDHVGGDEWGEWTSAHPQPLENGIEVHFSAGEYRTGDYWLIPARTTDRSVEWPGGNHPHAQPPRTIVHHCCPLALVKFDAKRHVWRVRNDRRHLFAPLASSATIG